ncbi:MAG: lysostaphin resistance A-like protein [Gemmataceae bacterium]
MIWSLLFVMFSVGIYVGFNQVNNDEELTDSEFREIAQVATGVMSFVDAILIVVFVFITWRPAAVLPIVNPWYAWFGSLPVLLLLLSFNIGLVVLIHWATGKNPLEEDDAFEFSWKRDRWLAVFFICAMPAIFEELFFRYLLLGHFHTHINIHLAVGASSALFALAHVGQIAGMPYLFVVGIVLGYLRVITGGLSLPILFHFLHNLAVVWLLPTLLEMTKK